MQNGDCNNRFLLLYGSQTGQAEAIAEEFRDRARELGLHPDFQCMKGADRSFNLEHETLAVILISTTGNGEAPDTAKKLVRRLKKRTLTKEHLKDLRYCLLGLGDSNYLNFCNSGKVFDRRLRELGAQPFQDTCYADDAVGLEVAADPWIVRTLTFLMQHFNIEVKPTPDTDLGNPLNMSSSINGPDVNVTLSYSSILHGVELSLPTLPQSYLSIQFKPEMKIDLSALPIQKNLPFPSSESEILTASIVKAKRLTTSPKVKEYIQLWFELKRSDIEYQPGDAFGFVPQNNAAEVNSILHHLGLSAVADTPCSISSSDNNRNVPSHLPPESTLQHLLAKCCDIRSAPKKTFLRAVAEHCKDTNDKRRLLELCSRQGSSEFLQLIRGKNLSILDLLKAFPSCNSIPVEVFLENLPRLQARYYSVANTPLEDPNMFTIVFSVVKFEAGEGRHADRTGVCTGYLTQCAKGLFDSSAEKTIEQLTSSISDMKMEEVKDIPVFKRKSSNFILPKDNVVPLIMIGPGTGVAPFISFLQHRIELRKRGYETFGETWLYYGCRHKEHDFLFERELKTFHKDGILNHLRLSFSRDADSPSVHVQSNIKGDFPLLLNLISEQDAVVFVCGDAKNMAKDVMNAFCESYECEKGTTSVEATQWFTKLQASKRFVQDLWL